MTFNQLKYVVAVAKTGSINKAAADLFISQSVVSTGAAPVPVPPPIPAVTTFSCAATAVLR